MIAEVLEQRAPCMLLRGHSLTESLHCAGNGSQWSRMGRELLETNATFRKSIEICAKALKPYGIDLIAAYESEDGFGDARTAATGLASIQVRFLRPLT